MDLQTFVNGLEPMSCIMSVQTFPDGNYGNIRIICGNKAYVDSIENPNNLAFGVMLNNKFVQNSPYENYIPKDLNFEDSCYRCAVLKKPFHTYIHPERYEFWVDMYMLPLDADEGDTHYFVYSQDLTPVRRVHRMTNINPAASATALEICFRLHGSKDLKSTMNEVMKEIRHLCGADAVCLIQTDASKRQYSVLSESINPEKVPQTVESFLAEDFDDFYDIVDTWEDSIAGSTGLIIQNEHDMQVLRERNPLWYESLKKKQVKSIVLYPLRYNEDTLGYIWVYDFNVEETAQIRETIESSVFFIASELANRRLLHQLKVMGTVDMLTGVRNRNAMNRAVDTYIDNGENLPDKATVVFADLNGLKKTNDNDGHASGDKLLKKAAKILQDTFPESEIYRAGGDEFMVLVYDLSEEEIKEKMKSLEIYRFDAEVSFALGYCYSDGSVDIRKAMSTADKRMYADKQLYYAQLAARAQE